MRGMQRHCFSLTQLYMLMYSQEFQRYTPSKKAWEILEEEYLNDGMVIKVKLQFLHRDFKTMVMEEREPIQ